MDLKGKNILITGGATRLGAAISTGLAKLGANILIHFNHSEEEAKKIQSEIEKMGQKAWIVQADFSKSDDLPKISDFLKKENISIEILINNAANFLDGSALQTSTKTWDESIQVNLKAPFFLSQMIAKQMSEKGQIIFIGDTYVKNPYPGKAAYLLSKGGIHTLVKILAIEWAPKIQVNGVAPGALIFVAGDSEERKKGIIDKTLLKKIGSPDDLVGTIQYLLTDATYSTGQMIYVDGGTHLI